MVENRGIFNKRQHSCSVAAYASKKNASGENTGQQGIETQKRGCLCRLQVTETPIQLALKDKETLPFYISHMKSCCRQAAPEPYTVYPPTLTKIEPFHSTTLGFSAAPCWFLWQQLGCLAAGLGGDRTFIGRSYFYVGLWEQGAFCSAMPVSDLPSQLAGRLWVMCACLCQLQA